MFIRVTSPAGYDLGWIKPDLIVSVSANPRYIKYRDGDRIVDAVVDPELVKHACRID